MDMKDYLAAEKYFKRSVEVKHLIFMVYGYTFRGSNSVIFIVDSHINGVIS